MNKRSPLLQTVSLCHEKIRLQDKVSSVNTLTAKLNHLHCSKRFGEVIHISGAGNTYIQFRGYERGKLYFNILADDGVTLSHGKSEGHFFNHDGGNEKS